MPLHIRQCSVTEIEESPNVSDLLAEYAKECALAGLPPPSPQFEGYKALEATGSFFLLGAYKEGALIGFMSFFVTTLPHYGVKVGTSESYFVTAEKRKTNAGVALRVYAEGIAKAHGAVGMLLSAPKGGRLESILPASGYAPTNTVFFKALP